MHRFILMSYSWYLIYKAGTCAWHTQHFYISIYIVEHGCQEKKQAEKKSNESLVKHNHTDYVKTTFTANIPNTPNACALLLRTEKVHVAWLHNDYGGVIHERWRAQSAFVISACLNHGQLSLFNLKFLTSRVGCSCLGCVCVCACVGKGEGRGGRGCRRRCPTNFKLNIKFTTYPQPFWLHWGIKNHF